MWELAGRQVVTCHCPNTAADTGVLKPGGLVRLRCARKAPVGYLMVGFCEFSGWEDHIL